MNQEGAAGSYHGWDPATGTTKFGFRQDGRWEEIVFTVGASFASTAVSEIGDRSFFTAVLLGLRYNRWIVFWGVFLALMVQSMTSSALGELFRYVTTAESGNAVALILSTVLFAVFSIRHLRESYYEWKENHRALDPTEMMLATHADGTSGSGIDFNFSLLDTEEGNNNTIHDKKYSNTRAPTVANRGVLSRLDTISADSLSPRKIQRLSSSSLTDVVVPAPTHSAVSPIEEEDRFARTGSVDQFARPRDNHALRIFWTAFMLTYIAEIGDSSMIVTATLASTKDPIVVFLGAIMANGVVNGFGIWAGGAISHYVNTFIINTIAGALFMFFALSSTLSLVSMCTAVHGTPGV